ncbi:MAG: hypothetical protein ACOYK9_04010 [Chlamydiia bacterium]
MDGTGAIAIGVMEDLLLKGIGLSVAGGALIEGTALLSAKLLKGNQNTAAKIAKFALASIALSAAFSLTVVAGFSSTLAVGGLISLVSEKIAVVIGGIIGVSVAAATLPIHWKAFQWAGLLNK